MKKLLTLAALLGAASLSFGQGSVNFSAGAAVATRIATNSAVGGASTGLTWAAATAGSQYYYALFVAPTTLSTIGGLDPIASGWSFAGAIGTNGASGRFSGNPTTDGTIIAGFGISSTANFVVVGWSANLGNDWNTVRTWVQNIGNNGIANAFYGVSGVATGVVLGGGAIPQGNIFGANPGQIGGFTLGLTPVVPEPSSFALAGLGAAALLIFRRRK